MRRHVKEMAVDPMRSETDYLHFKAGLSLGRKRLFKPISGEFTLSSLIVCTGRCPLGPGPVCRLWCRDRTCSRRDFGKSLA